MGSGGRRRPYAGRYARFGLGVLALAFGAGSLAVARHDPSGSFGGASVRDGLLELGAGWSLALAGLAFWERQPRNRFGPLLVAAGFAWFLPEWSNPSVGVAFAFTVALVGFVSCAPLVAHAALCYPRGRVGSVLERGVLVVAYAGAIALLGLLPAAVFDPAAQGCLECPDNLVLVHGNAGALASFTRWGIRAGLAWTVVLAGLIVWRLARAATRERVGPVLAPAAVYLGLVAWDLQHSLATNVLSNDAFDVRAWRLEAAVLVATAAGVAWGIYRLRRARAEVAQLVADLGAPSGPGGVAVMLARALGDADLELLYRPEGSSGYVDAHGRPAGVQPRAGRTMTPLRRGDRPVAALLHDEILRRDPGLVEEVVGAAALAIENERSNASVLAQLESLRESRARIVETGDRERRRLERDLHDGAQQRLVGLSLALRLVRTLSPASTPALEARLAAADAELRATLAGLRELAHGIFPAVLADEGLAAAVEALIDGSPAAVEVRSLPEARFAPAVEFAAYFVLAETLAHARPATASLAVARDDGRLVVEVETDGSAGDWLSGLEDRVGALGGRLAFTGDDRLRVRAELPCA